MKNKTNYLLILLSFLFAINIMFAQESEYCGDAAYHFQNPAEVPSMIYLTITNTDANSMYVEIESADDDPVDLLLVLGGSGADISDETYPADGKIRRTLTWDTPPDNVTLNLLWSKLSFGGNWQLSQNDLEVPFAASCNSEPQVYTMVDFEDNGVGADWAWTMDQNDDNPPLEFVANPDMTDPNSSAKVAKFTARQNGMQWALTYTDDMEDFQFDATNTTVKIMVHKPVVSDVAIKLEGGSPEIELKVPNTVVNAWEELTFDFSGQIGNSYNKLVIIPDFADRTQDNVIYLDNIQLPMGNIAPPSEPTVAAPVPTHAADDVVSLFSNTYNNVAVDTWSADWDQADVADVQIEGNDTKKYTNLNYAGIEFVNPTVDASGMTYLHMDFWTPDPTTAPSVFKIKLVDFGADNAFGGGDDSEHELILDANSSPAIGSEEWFGLDIPLASFINLTSTGNLAQMIVSGDPNTVYLDNIYFYSFEVGENYTMVDFETGGLGLDWAWTMDQNDDNPPLEFVANPDMSDPNTSATVAKFTARQNGMQWALTYTDDMEDFQFDATNTTVKIMVHKPVVSDVAIKFEGGSPAIELKVPNTVVNAWEVLTFDFSGQIGNSYSKLVIIPDFADRTQDNVIYLDNIQLPMGNIAPPSEPTVAAPAPVLPQENVISLFSNAYTDVTVDTWSADWDQADYEDVQIEGNDTKKYTNLNYAGIEFTTQTVDASELTHLHMDFWTPDPTTTPSVFKIKLVDFGADGAFGGGDDTEHELTLDANTSPALMSEVWVPFDITLTSFAGLGSTAHLAQMIISGDPNTVYIDNVYFYTNEIIPVELTSFAANALNGKVRLEWSTATETNNKGFEIEKSTDNKNFSSIAFVDGFGTTTETQNYSFTDSDAIGSALYYRLKQIDFDGTYAYSDVVEVNAVPSEFALEQNYPNPFNPSTKINFSIPVNSVVKLSIYNSLGELVAVPVNGLMEAGTHRVNFNAANLTSGVYYYRIEAGDFVENKKMMLLK